MILIDGYGCRFDLFPIPQIKTCFSQKEYEQYKKETDKMSDKFDRIVELRNKKQELEKQLSKCLLEIEYDKRDLEELQKAMDYYNDHIKMMKEYYVKISQTLSETDQKLKDLHK